MSETLTELLGRCKDGDEAAITALVGRFHQWALEVAHAYVYDKASAEDVVQETFIAALHGIEQLETAEAFPGWLRRILRRQAIRFNRRGGKVTGHNHADMSAGSVSPREHAEHDELGQLVRRALEMLPPAERDTAVRFYIEQDRCIDIACALSVPPSTVRRRLFDARTHLRNMLLGHIDIGTEKRHDESIPKGLPF